MTETWLQANGTKQTVPRKSYDLSTSAKWATLTEGNHNVQIVAKASGYRDSEKSAAVVVNKPVTLEAGTYNFKDGFDWNNIPYQPLLFKSNGIDYIKFQPHYEFDSPLAATLRYYKDNSNFDTVCNFTQSGNIVWLNNAYKTITLSTDQQVSAEFYKWAITDGNLVKNEEPSSETWLLNETISFDCPRTNIDFSSNNENFSKIKCTNFGQFERYLYYETPSNSIIVCSEESTGLVWSNSSYRTIIFATPPTGDLLTWLQANGNKQ